MNICEKVFKVIVLITLFYFVGIFVGAIFIELFFGIDTSIEPVWTPYGILFGCWNGLVAVLLYKAYKKFW